MNRKRRSVYNEQEAYEDIYREVIRGAENLLIHKRMLDIMCP